MLNTLLLYLPIPVAPLLAIALAVGLRRWVKHHSKPSLSAAVSTATDLIPATAAKPPKVTWEDIADHTHPLVAYLLPIIASAVILLLALWPFAYLGWILISSDPTSGVSATTPPWFGNLGYFLGFGAAGLLTAVAGAIVAGGLVLGLHVLGKCILWPQVCGCGDTESAPSQDRADAPRD